MARVKARYKNCLSDCTKCSDTVCPSYSATQPADKQPIHDVVNHPSHYTYGKIEVIDVIETFDLCFHLGNVLKYILRAGKKNDTVEDLKKARWYLDRYISNVEKEQKGD